MGFSMGRCVYHSRPLREGVNKASSEMVIIIASGNARQIYYREWFLCSVEMLT